MTDLFSSLTDFPVIDFGVKSTLLVALCLAAGWLMRRASASGRHVLLLAGMISLLVLPALELALPRWQVPIWVQRVDAASAVSSAAPSSAQIPVWLWVFAWLAGAAALSIRWLLGLREIAKVRRTSSLPSEWLRARVENLLTEASSRCQVQLVLGGPDLSPMTWGWWRPVLALPSGAEEWPDERLRAVVLHEMAHIERGDWLSHELARVGCVLYWFHPGVWLVAHGMERESEHAADDRVISLGCAPEDYAEHLVDVARSVRFARNHVAVAMARRSPIGDRLQAVLAMGRNRAPMARWAKTGLFMGCGALAAVVAAAGPTLLVQSHPVATVRPIAEGPWVSVSAAPVQLTADNFPTGPDSKQEESSCPNDSNAKDSTGSDPSVSNPSSCDQSQANDDSSADDSTDSNDPSPQTTPVPDIPPVPDKAATVAKANEKQISDRIAAAFKEASKQVATAERRMETKMTVSKSPEIDQEIPEVNVDTPDIKIDTQNIHLQIPGVHVHVPSIHIHVPAIRVDVPSSNDGCSG